MAKRKTAGAKSESGPVPVAGEVKEIAKEVDDMVEQMKKDIDEIEGTPIRNEWRELELAEIKDADSYKSCDVVIRRDQQKHGFGNRIYKRLRTAGEGTGYCVLIYDKK